MSFSQAAFRSSLSRGSDWTSFTSSGSPMSVLSAAAVWPRERTAVIGDHLLRFWYSQQLRALQARSKHGPARHRRRGGRPSSSAACHRVNKCLVTVLFRAPGTGFASLPRGTGEEDEE